MPSRMRVEIGEQPEALRRTFDALLPQVGALEALIGFVLIGWSTAFMVRTLRRIID